VDSVSWSGGWGGCARPKAFLCGCAGVKEPHTGTRPPLATITVGAVPSKALTGLGLERELKPSHLEPRGPEVPVHEDLASSWVDKSRGA